MAVFSIVPFDELTSTARWDGEFYQPHLLALANRLKQSKATPLKRYVAQAQRGQAPAYNEKGTVPVIRTVNVRDLELSEERIEYVTKTFFDENTKGHVCGGNIVVTSTGMGTLGRTFCNLYDRNYFADGHITVLQLRDRTQGQFLTAVLQSSIGIQQFEQRQRGSSGQIEIYPEDILSVLIPKLPPETVKSITAKWTEAVQLVEDSKRLYPEAEAELLDRIGWRDLAAKSAELFYVEQYETLADRQRFDAEHYQPKYKRLCDRLHGLGAQTIKSFSPEPRRGIQPEFCENGEVSVIDSKAVRPQGVEPDKKECTSRKFYESTFAEKGRVTRGDVLLNSTGMGTLGRASFYYSDTQALADNHVAIIHPDPKSCLPLYLSLFLNSPAGLAQSEMFQTGSSGQLEIYPQHIRAILVFLPKTKTGKIDLAWQGKLADKVLAAARAKTEARAKLDEAKRIVEKAIT